MDLHQLDWDELPRANVREGVDGKGFHGKGVTRKGLIPAHEPRLHSSAYEQMVYIVRGVTGLCIQRLDAGGLLIVPRNARHSGQAADDEPAMNLDVSTPWRHAYA